MTIEERVAALEQRVEDLEELLEEAECRASAARESAGAVEAGLQSQVRRLELELSDERADRERAEKKHQRGW